MIRPLSNRVIVQRIDSGDRTSGGLYIPEVAKEKPTQGVVVAVGEGLRHPKMDGVRFKPLVKVGDRILFGKYSGHEAQVLEKDILVIREEEILGVIENA